MARRQLDAEYLNLEVLQEVLEGKDTHRSVACRRSPEGKIIANGWVHMQENGAPYQTKNGAIRLNWRPTEAVEQQAAQPNPAQQLKNVLSKVRQNQDNEQQDMLDKLDNMDSSVQNPPIPDDIPL